MLLDGGLGDFGVAGEAGPQRVPGVQRAPLGLWQVRPQLGGQHRLFDKPGDVFVKEPGVQHARTVLEARRNTGPRSILPNASQVFERLNWAAARA